MLPIAEYSFAAGIMSRGIAPIDSLRLGKALLSFPVDAILRETRKVPMNQASKKKILIADDDPGMRLALLVRLRANNYDVACVGDGLSVIFEARRNSPDLIILDLGLPSGDGFTVLEMLQTDDAHACIPVIVLSGREADANKDRAIDAGALMFLQKPVGTSELLTAVEHALQVTGGTPSRAASGRA